MAKANLCDECKIMAPNHMGNCSKNFIDDEDAFCPACEVWYKKNPNRNIDPHQGH